VLPDRKLCLALRLKPTCRRQPPSFRYRDRSPLDLLRAGLTATALPTAALTFLVRALRSVFATMSSTFVRYRSASVFSHVVAIITPIFAPVLSVGGRTCRGKCSHTNHEHQTPSKNKRSSLHDSFSILCKRVICAAISGRDQVYVDLPLGGPANSGGETLEYYQSQVFKSRRFHRFWMAQGGVISSPQWAR
jgi:hypothetical protein